MEYLKKQYVKQIYTHERVLHILSPYTGDFIVVPVDDTYKIKQVIDVVSGIIHCGGVHGVQGGTSGASSI